MAGDREGNCRREILSEVVMRADDVHGLFERAKDAAGRADQGPDFDDKVTAAP